jgi:hypothetical protein
MEEAAQLDEEAIRARAYEISLRADGGTPEENWRRAREELLDELWADAHRATRRDDRAGGDAAA